MFTKDDFRNYFEEVAKLENLAMKSQADLFGRISNPELREPLARIMADEARHAKMAEELLHVIGTGGK